MTLDSQLAIDVQRFDVGEYVELFELDLSPIGGEIMRVTPHIRSTVDTGEMQIGEEELWIGGEVITLPYISFIKFNGNTYISINCKSEGFEFTTNEQMPRPTFMLSVIGDTGYTLRSLIRNYDDLIGIPFTRRRTLEKYLDGSAQPEFPQDEYVLERKISQNSLAITWELSAYVDREGDKVPKRLILRENCGHVYRLYDGTGSFNYSQATCPYTGSSYYNTNGVACTLAEDKCGKKLSDCKLRYPSSALPFRGFPGVSRIRI